MIKFAILSIFMSLFLISVGFSQNGSDGSYLWNTVQVNYQVNAKYELVFTNRLFFNTQIDRFDLYFFDLTGYRKLNNHFSMGLGIRKLNSYKAEEWNPVNIFWTYGIFYAQAAGMKIKLANRFGYKMLNNNDSQLAFDNISSVDFFTKSTSKIPKPYMAGEVFSELKSMQIQHCRLFGGLHLMQKEHLGIDVFYALWKARSEPDWKAYHVFGLSTKFHV